MGAPSAERWAAIEPVLDDALDLAPEGRPAFLSQACSHDPELLREIECLLRAGETTNGFLRQPAAEYASPLVVRVAEHQALPPGTWLGTYLIEGELGRGGMATVYLARDPKHQRPVALKVLRPELSGVLGAERFAREIAIAARLSHPHIVPLHDSGAFETGTGPPVLFYAMPYVAGRSLRERLREEPQLPVDEALGVARDVAAALDYAHRQGVIHRDLKPENILLADGAALVADFGIARALDAAGGERLTETGLALGTPAYMSPEQATGSTHLDGRGDLYALGCVLYETLAGQPPFTGPTPQAVLARHAADPVPSLRTVRTGVSISVEAAIGKALAKVPADRFATAGEFVHALDQASRAAEVSRPRSRPRRRELVLAVAALAVAAVTALSLAVGNVLRRPPNPVSSDPKLVAVLPFRTSGASPELAWLREGLVDLLAIKLAGEGNLLAADPPAVLTAWRRVAGPEGRDIAPEAALEVAHRVGAGRVIAGGVVGTPGHLVLSASLLGAPGGRNQARVSVEGPADSLSALVDRLTAQLLGGEAGVPRSQLAPLASTSLPAIRAYLSGRGAFRTGNTHEAFRRFDEATRLDSTFALAALELVHAAYYEASGGESPEAARAKRLAQAGRGRLGPGDRALLDVWAAPFATAPELFRRWQAAARENPDRAEIWYGLGDAYYHNGMFAGLGDPKRLASEAFQRAWAIDQASGGDTLAAERSPMLTHMVEIAQVNGDTATVRRLSGLRLAADSISAQAWYLRWHRAVTLGDSARRVFWADSQRMDPETFTLIHRFTASADVGVEDYPRAARLMLQRWEADDPDAALFHRHVVALNGGRPQEAARDRFTARSLEAVSSGLPIREALYWGGDTSVAAEAARRLTPSANGPVASGYPGMNQLHGLCAVAAWRLARGDYRYAEATIRRLRGAVVLGLSRDDSIAVAEYQTLCAAQLEAVRATDLRLPEARARLLSADAAARSFIVGQSLAANLVVARVAEMQGELQLALRAVRRRAGIYDMLPTWYLSSFLREEGRLAALTGDTAGAVRAYRHYLALRPDPESAVRPEVDRVRAELARLSPRLGPRVSGDKRGH